MSFLLLMIAFVCTGLNQLTSKMLVEWGLGAHRDLYLLGMYVAALVLGLSIMLKRRQPSSPVDRNVGIVMGITGALATLFFIIALEHMPGIVAFPVRGMGNLSLTALVSIVAWKEKLSPSQWLGVAFSLAAIWLVS